MNVRHRIHRAGRILPALLLAGLLAEPAFAGKLRVETDGVDSGSCGGKHDPCRTISRAILLARDGDTILVGPGRYGDLDRDGTLGEPEEESGEGCYDCAVRVYKRLKILSRAGAAATVIDAGRELYYAVAVTADGAILGRKKRGFTLVAPGLISVLVEGDDVRVEGNLSTASNHGFRSDGARTLFRGNSVFGNGNGGFTAALNATDTTFIDNRAIGNGWNPGTTGSSGFATVGGGARLTRNVAAANQAKGISSLLGGDVIVKNVVAGNRRDQSENRAGIAVSFDGVTGPVLPSTITRNLIVGNDGPGLRFKDGASGTAAKNTIYGNDPGQNCGIRNAGGRVVDAAKSFWGDPDGPSGDPGDAVCVTDGTVISQPVAARAGRVRLRAAR